jgi:hypothetical protein
MKNYGKFMQRFTLTLKPAMRAGVPYPPGAMGLGGRRAAYVEGTSGASRSIPATPLPRSRSMAPTGRHQLWESRLEPQMRPVRSYRAFRRPGRVMPTSQIRHRTCLRLPTSAHSCLMGVEWENEGSYGENQGN